MRGMGSEPLELAPGPAITVAVREAEFEQWAHRRVRSLRFFYTHFTLFVVLNIVLLLIDVSTPGDPWFYKVLLGWGLVVGLHALHTYELLPWSTQNWEQRKIQEFIEEARARFHRR